ncbi:hypothetical protein BRX37_08340 [Sphingomonas sp. S-NIH.Pt3_0716]|nr:hypothetical protein BRX37_08340 [Sphingomonas sp. S-NIH.Pt3_0716]
MTFMKPEQFRSWAERAQPGEDVVYAEGVRPGDAIGATVRGLHDAGLVAMTSKRVDGRLRFIAQRLPDPRPSQLRARQVPQRGRFQLAANDGAMTTRAVLRILQQAAARGLPCPTNEELAKRVGLNGKVAASYRVRRLVQLGKISVEEPSPLERRVVTILATGKQTQRAML